MNKVDKVVLSTPILVVTPFVDRLCNFQFSTSLSEVACYKPSAEAVTERDMREIRHRLLASQRARLRTHRGGGRGGTAEGRRRLETQRPIRGLEIDTGFSALSNPTGPFAA